MPPLVSVIIPSYNYGRFVREAVGSALAQTYRPIEIIVVDDGSKDNSREVMQAYAVNPLVQYIRQENKGLPAARNTGIRAAQGKYIALLDADDVWAPEKIAQQVSFCAEHPEAAIVATDSYGFMDGSPLAPNLKSQVSAVRPHPSSVATNDSGVSSNSAIPHPSHFTTYNLRDLLEFSPFCPSSVLMPKDRCEAVGMFDEQLRYVEDLDMWARMAAQGSIVRLEAALTGSRGHPAVQSMHTGPNLEYHRRVLDKLFATISEYQAHPSWRHLAEARMYAHVSWMKHQAGDQWGALADLGRSTRSFRALKAREGSQPWLRLKLFVRYIRAAFRGSSQPVCHA